MDEKVRKELKAFKEFKENFEFKQNEIIKDGDNLYCNSELIQQGEERPIGESDKWINVGYKLKGAFSNVLSNLFPYDFIFNGKHLSSIESFFQGIKIKDKDTQDYVFKYSGLDSNYIKAASDFDWKETGIVYWQGKAIVRDSEEYDDLVDELYISAIQNPLYRNVLKNVNKPIIHSIGKDDKNETVFTRYEFEFMLNCLVEFLKEKQKYSEYKGEKDYFNVLSPDFPEWLNEYIETERMKKRVPNKGGDWGVTGGHPKSGETCMCTNNKKIL